MSVNTQPIFIKNPVTDGDTIITAATATDGTNSTQLFDGSAATYGSRIHAITGTYFGTVSTQSVLRLFRESSGNYTIIGELLLELHTTGTGVPSPVMDFMSPLSLPYVDPADRSFYLGSGESLYGAVLVTIESALNLTVWGGIY